MTLGWTPRSGSSITTYVFPGKMRRAPIVGLLMLVMCPMPGFSIAQDAIVKVPALRSTSLKHIISYCTDEKSQNYENCDRAIVPRKPPGNYDYETCMQTTEMWHRRAGYVAMRDRKMCECKKGSDFVHGLVMPLDVQVAGVPDRRSVPDIWEFAWYVAEAEFGSSEPDAALAINPRALASQNILHIHVVRLNLLGQAILQKEGRIAASLMQVWPVAEKMAGTDDFGVLVAKHKDGFIIFASYDYIERKYTQERCLN